MSLLTSFEELFNVFDDETPSKFSEERNSKISNECDEIQIIDAQENIKKQQSTTNEFFNKLTSSSKRESEDFDEYVDEVKKIKLDPFENINLDDYSSRIKVHIVDGTSRCNHEVAIPPDSEYKPLIAPQTKPAKEYKFILDVFQKEAILCIENCESVLVSAHTSAGKTVVAEYAVALSLRDKKRVIYTTPIKALSNQKYREFYEEFQDVGLMTGDVTINPTASCLIMTTEILRSMLYRGSQIMREVGWVIFDEIHYMRDKERGYVWEETIILLPDNVKYVFLSATIPNARQFAEWICQLHKQPCHVIYTEYRPVPLQHYIFPAGGDGLHMVVDENGQFREENFNMAMSVLQNAGEAKDHLGRKGGMVGSNCYKIVKMIMERNFAPVIVFSFSKKECEAYALQMAKLDFNTSEEKKLVDEVFHNAMDVLSDEDKKLPQVEAVLPLLRRGIGIHHGGLLPILKETIEILFSEGLIKALFATETFSMGLNMPARTVLFTSARKFDGKNFRNVSSGEYIQMSGRAGRRGLDDKGIVILMMDEKIPAKTGRDLVQGLPDQLNSAFHLTYNMILNLLRVEEINPEYMLEKSFFQFQNYAAIPKLYEKLQSIKAKYDAFVIPQEEDVAAYYRIRQQLKNLSKEFQAFLIDPQYLVPFLQPGRMVKIKNEDDDFGWGIIVNYKKIENKVIGENAHPETSYIVDVLLHLSARCDSVTVTSQLKPCPKDERGVMKVVPCVLNLIHQISSVRIYYPSDLKPLDNRMSVLKSIQEVQKRFPKGVPLLNPIEDMKIKNKSFVNLIKKIEIFEKRMYNHPIHQNSQLAQLYTMYSKKMQLFDDLQQVQNDLKKARSILQMDELKCRKRVLRRLGYCTSSDIIEVKGRVACELNSADELLLTEMIFNGVFNELTVPQSVALLSCFVTDEKASELPKLTEELSGPLREMQKLAGRIAKVSQEAKITIDEDNYVEQFKPFLMDVVNAWCKGATFASVCKMTDIFEGSIIRSMRRLEELLRQMMQASKAIGNSELENKFAEGIKLIKRDIVFAASLYL